MGTMNPHWLTHLSRGGFQKMLDVPVQIFQLKVSSGELGGDPLARVIWQHRKETGQGVVALEVYSLVILAGQRFQRIGQADPRPVVIRFVGPQGFSSLNVPVHGLRMIPGHLVKMSKAFGHGDCPGLGLKILIESPEVGCLILLKEAELLGNLSRQDVLVGPQQRSILKQPLQQFLRDLVLPLKLLQRSL
jgi:hypothetical protein